MPEGVQVDQALIEQLSPEFKEMGLTTAQAQKLADKFIAHQQAQAASRSDGFAKTVSGWADEAKADKEMGGDKWTATASTAAGAVEQFGTPELKAYLNETGGGNHPEVIRFAAKMGAEIARLKSMIKEDDPATDTAQGGKVTQDAASVLYPNDKPKSA
jgi:hypothetical protein